ncbi:hypothetical protein D3C75_1215370 [compost metagenome]
MIVLGAFLGRTFGNFARNVSHAVEVAGKGHGIKRHHLRGGDVIHFLDLGTVRQGYSVTLAGRGLSFEEAANVAGW